MSAFIHASAIVHADAAIGDDCHIGPFCTVGAGVKLGAGVRLDSHVVIDGITEIGDETHVHPFVSIGLGPQDLKYAGEPTSTVIGKRNQIREFVTIHRGTVGGGGVTRIGDDCLLLAGSHVAHDAQVGNNVTIVNSAAVAGHCVIEDDVIIGGLAGIHQWVRIGRGAIIGAVSMVTHDVIPYGLVQAARGELDGLNLIGLKRRGMDRADIRALLDAYEALKSGEGSFQDRAARLAGSTSPAVREVAEFILGPSDRQFLTPR